MLLELEKVSRFYGPRLVFKDVSMAVRSGTVTLLAGANGAGKSTLLKIMAGLLRPSAGKVVRGRKSEGSGKSGGVPLLGYLGHQTFLYPDLSAVENLRFWTAMQDLRLPERAYADILDRIELGPFAEEKAGSFSRGMAQRLNLARVFLPKPDVLLLDEPGTGLDTRSTAILHREIAGARAEGAGIVWITHNLSDDLRRADTAAVLDNKTLRYYGPAGEYGETARPPDGFAAPRFARGGEPC